MKEYNERLDWIETQSGRNIVAVLQNRRNVQTTILQAIVQHFSIDKICCYDSDANYFFLNRLVAFRLKSIIFTI